ncbi:MAG: hypothetical protein E7022_04995 [Desulfovibrio desulfuricans]|jgi:SEC-C motif-containing protein|nr:hypothetical protein [Desulfovibrio desulfuricans]
MSELCPCGSGRTLEDCCGPYIDGKAWPPDAATLMRSRYTAYVLQCWQWLVESTHPDYREDVSVEKLAESARDVRWLRLDIRSAVQDVPAGEKGELFDVVEFFAYYELDGVRQLGERSFFQRRDDKLYYVDGVALRPEAYRRETPKVGRNDPCPCGSGKKYKKCCGAAAS